MSATIRSVKSRGWTLPMIGLLMLSGWLQADDQPPKPALPLKLSLSSIHINEADVRPHVEFLASPQLQGRGPAGKAKAREYLIQHFQQLKLRPLFGDSFVQRLPSGVGDSDEPQFVGANVGAYLPATSPEGANEWIILNAHYDHLGAFPGGYYPGADDNASSIAMLLETARQLSQQAPPRRNIAFVAFDLEEQLLWGSRWFVSHPPCELSQIKFCITADLLGRSLGNLPMRSVFVMGSETAPQLRGSILGDNPSGRLDVKFLGGDMVGTRSDYGPFRDQGIPFLFFSTGEHPDYHTPEDTPDKIDYPKLAEISTLMARLTHDLGSMPSVPEWTPPDATDIIDAVTIRQVTEELLRADQQGRIQLSGLQRAFVTQLESKTSYAIRRGHMSPEERGWLIRSAQILLISIF